MVEDQQTLLQVLWPLYAVGRSLGIMPLKLEWRTRSQLLGKANQGYLHVRPLRKFWRYVPLTGLVSCFVFLIYTFPYWLSMFLRQHTSTDGRSMDFTNVFIITLEILSSLTTLRFVYGHASILVHVLQSLDLSCSQLTTQSFYQSFGRTLKMSLIIHLIFNIVYVFYEPYLWPPEEMTTRKLAGFLVIRFINMNLEYQFFVFMLLLKCLLELLNARIVVVGSRAEGVTELRVHHRHLCSVLWALNQVYGASVLAWVTRQFFDIITGVFFFLISMMQLQNKDGPTLDVFNAMTGSLTWTPVVLLRLFMLCWVGDEVNTQVQRTSLILQTLSRAPRTDRSTLEEIGLFLDELLHQDSQFSVCGVFPLNKSLYFTVLGMATTYLVILMQFSVS